LVGLAGVISIGFLGVQPAQAWRFLPKEGVFIYPHIDGAGYLAVEPPPAIGQVITTKAERAVHIGKGEVVYVNVGTRNGIKVGDRLIAFSLLKPLELRDVRVVVIEARLQITEVKEEEAAAFVEESYRSLSLGALVDRYVPRESKMPLTPAPASVMGRIVWSYEGLVNFGEGDMVFLNRGAVDGVGPGQCYQVYRTPMAEVERPPFGAQKSAPPKDHLTTSVGELVILRAERNTSTALVRKSLLPMSPGEYFRAGCAWEEAAKKVVTPPKAAAAPDDAARRAREAFENVDVLFAYDSYVLSDAAQALLQAKAQFLKNNPDVQVVIEGHCDERGTREYNLALGDRRANAAQRYLTGLGVAGERMKTVSYGKERPLDPGQNEAAWAKNRRAHFVIQAR